LEEDVVLTLERLYQISGLSKLLAKSCNEIREMGGRRVGKLQFAENPWLLSALEIWPTKERRHLRICYREHIPVSLKQLLSALPGGVPRNGSDNAGVNYDGDFLAISSNLAGVLSAARVQPRDAALERVLSKIPTLTEKALAEQVEALHIKLGALDLSVPSHIAFLDAASRILAEIRQQLLALSVQNQSASPAG
jgi:hypothetical protein